MSDKQIKERPRYIPVVNTVDFSRVFAMEYSEDSLHIDVLDLLHDKSSGHDFKLTSFEYRIILRDDYERLLSQVGFVERHYFGNYQFEPYDKESSNRLIAVAQR